MHYILTYDVIDGFISKRDAFREQHLEHVRRAYDRGDLVLAGALADPTDGAVLVFRGPSPQPAETFAQSDPYVTSGLVPTWRVRKWMTSLTHSTTDEMHVNLDRFSLPPRMQLRDTKIEYTALRINAELEEQDRHDRVSGNGLGLALAPQLIKQSGRAYPNRVPRGLTHRQEQSVKDFICRNLAKDFSLIELAALTGISPSHFRVLFKQSVGMPVHKYVVKCRVEYAIELLSKGRVKLSDVALNSGFADQSHMSRCMRRFIGLTPAEVKRSVS